MLGEIRGRGFSDGFGFQAGGAGAFGAAFEFGELFRVHVHAENTAFIAHQSGEVQRLAASSGTGVDDALARLRIDQWGDHLRSGVLDFHPAISAQGFRQGFPGSKHQCVRQAGHFGGLRR